MKTIIGIGVYAQEDYERLLEIAADSNTMCRTWKEWKFESQKAMKNIKQQGMKPIRVQINLDELLMFCELKGIPLNGEARASFVSEQLRSKNAKDRV